MRTEKAFALKINTKDNVAVVLSNNLHANQYVTVRDQTGKVNDIKAIDDIPYGHKIAIAAMAPGEKIVKYGEIIGASSKPIALGEHVHIHNMVSLRGRGDLNSDV